MAFRIAGLKDSTHIISWIFVIYLISCGFQHILYFPFLKDKIQLPELIFSLGIMLCITKINFLEIFSKRYLTAAFLQVLLPFLWFVVHLISLVLHPNDEGLLECLGILYLILVFIFFRLDLEKIQFQDFRNKILQAFSLLGWLMSGVSLITYVLSVYWKPNYTAQVFYDYPYFGDVFRLQGFTTTPAMYISIICLPIGFSLFNYLFGSNKRNDLLAALFFSGVALLTLSKSALFIGYIWIALFAFKKKLNKWVSILIGLIILCIHVFLTHFLILPLDESKDDQFRNGPYTSNERLIETNSYAICGSGYYQFKKTAYQIFKDNFWLGVGPGNYNTTVNELKDQGFYPQNLPAYDPHSSPLGALATTGIFGFLIWLSIFIIVILKLNHLHPLRDSFSHLLWVLIMVAFAESMSMDIMNFRHYWILAIILVVHRSE